MRKYELLITLPGTFDENEASTHINEVLEVVKGFGQDAEMNNLGKIRLAYPIKQIRYGYYYTIVFAAEPKQAKELEEKLKLRTDLLRSIMGHFKTNATATKKIIYSTNDAGVTTMKERDESVKEEETAKVDLKAIDEKLNEILDNDIIPGV